MRNNGGFIKLIILFALMALVLAVVAVFVIRQADASRSNIPELGNITQFTFTDQNGQPFGSDTMKGKINIVDFFFTTCPNVCPVMTRRMADLYEKFADSDKIHFVSVTTDPTNDSLKALRNYASAYGANDGRWSFIRGTTEETASLSETCFKLSADQLPLVHSVMFVLVDQNGVIRGYYDSNDEASLELLSKHIVILAKKLS